MESVLASSSAWTPKYKEVGDVDDTRTPECAESFMTLLTVITGNVTRDIAVMTSVFSSQSKLFEGEDDNRNGM